MGKYIKLNNLNIVENIIVAEEEFINQQNDKEKYIKQFENFAEKEESLKNEKYSLNLGNIGDLYNYKKRKFKNSQPYPSWIWNEEEYEWKAPVEKPHSVYYVWDENKKEWIKFED
jgi:DNA helicase HerA-like ATPase